MAAAADAVIADFERRREQQEMGFAHSAKVWEDFARELAEKVVAVSDESRARGQALIEAKRELLLAQAVIEEENQNYIELLANYETLIAERDLNKQRLHAVWTVFQRMVRCVRSRTPVGYFPELTEQSIKKALQQALR